MLPKWTQMQVSFLKKVPTSKALTYVRSIRMWVEFPWQCTKWLLENKTHKCYKAIAIFSMNWYKMFFVQTSTPKFKHSWRTYWSMEHVACKAFNQLPTKSPIKSNDGSTSYTNYANWSGLVKARTCMSPMCLVGQLVRRCNTLVQHSQPTGLQCYFLVE
jgi:hypothetical protein